eukprot:3292336-Prorocentrum_lima.AAC.1
MHWLTLSPGHLCAASPTYPEPSPPPRAQLRTPGQPEPAQPQPTSRRRKKPPSKTPAQPTPLSS